MSSFRPKRSGEPVSSALNTGSCWIPAFAGMTVEKRTSLSSQCTAQRKSLSSNLKMFPVYFPPEIKFALLPWSASEGNSVMQTNRRGNKRQRTGFMLRMISRNQLDPRTRPVYPYARACHYRSRTICSVLCSRGKAAVWPKTLNSLHFLQG